MKENKNMDEKINETLNSLEGLDRASPGPYFFTRLQQRLQSSKKSTWEIVARFISKPAFALGSLLIVILLNIALLVNNPAKSDRFEDGSDDYSIAASLINIYENPETE